MNLSFLYIADKEMWELNELNVNYCKSLSELKDAKAQYSTKKDELIELKEKHEDMGKEYEIVSRYRLNIQNDF